ncbi:dTDP-4-amino-4,6-dideoxygalactose transaminase [Pycnococcus provasolii]
MSNNLCVKRLDFDSRVLGIETARILSEAPITSEQVDETLQACSRDGKTTESSDVVDFAFRNGHNVSGKVTYEMKVNQSLIAALNASSNDILVFEYTSDSADEALRRLSVLSGGLSRFCVDPNLTRQAFEYMFETWIENCCKTDAADVVFIAQSQGCKTVGMVTLKKKSGHVSIVLIAVDESGRRKGVATCLLAKAYEWTLQQNLDVVRVSTQQTNHAARKVYEKCGGLCVEAEYDFHFWTTLEPFDDPKSSDIPNCKPFLVGHELDNITDMFSSRSIATHAKYGPLCQEFLEKELGAMKVLLVCSGTAGLEVSSLCCDIQGGDEVIVPSYTFVSTANAFVLHGATPVFVDIRSDTQNIDETKIEAAITDKTKAIAVVHYAGVPCEMDAIMDIAERRNLIVVEDNAHGVFSSYKGRKLGTIGHLGVLSFHYTKNIICGEGGAVIVNRPQMLSRAMIAWEKGTNRFDFLRGKVDRYAWVDRGSSFVQSELQSAVLYAQLCNWQQIIKRRLHVWNTYHALLEPSERAGRLRRPIIPDGCAHNAHIYYVRIPDPTHFFRVAELAKECRVGIFTHYVPLHSSTGGSKYGRASDSLLEVNRCYTQLYRLPMWVGMTEDEIRTVVKVIADSVSC